MNFSHLRPTRRPPDHVVVLAPRAFADAYPKRPAADVAVGLRRLSQSEAQTAMAEARKESTAGDRSGEAASERFGEALVCWSVGFAACDPNDAGAPYFACGDEEIRQALTPEGIRRLWDELEMIHAAESPLLTPLADDDAADLANALAHDGLARLSTAKATRVRRWLRFVLDELRAAGAVPESTPTSDDELPDP